MSIHFPYYEFSTFYLELPEFLGYCTRKINERAPAYETKKAFAEESGNRLLPLSVVCTISSGKEMVAPTSFPCCWSSGGNANPERGMVMKITKTQTIYI